MSGRIIFVNGASSSGKSTLCAGLQARLPEPFWHFSIDHLSEAKVLPMARIKNGDFQWSAMHAAFFEGFHRCIPALAAAGNNVLVEHIIEEESWRDRLAAILAPFDTFFVGLHCPVEELRRRERLRGDRPIGDAERDFGFVHAFARYDCELDSTRPVEENVALVLAAWTARSGPSAFMQPTRADG